MYAIYAYIGVVLGVNGVAYMPVPLVVSGLRCQNGDGVFLDLRTMSQLHREPPRSCLHGPAGATRRLSSFPGGK